MEKPHGGKYMRGSAMVVYIMYVQYKRYRVYKV
jgi:hypothetical protein